MKPTTFSLILPFLAACQVVPPPASVEGQPPANTAAPAPPAATASGETTAATSAAGASKAAAGPLRGELDKKPFVGVTALATPNLQPGMYTVAVYTKEVTCKDFPMAKAAHVEATVKFETNAEASRAAFITYNEEGIPYTRNVKNGDGAEIAKVVVQSIDRDKRRGRASFRAKSDAGDVDGVMDLVICPKWGSPE